MTKEEEDEEITRFGVAVIESLRDNEYRTGSLLYHDVLKPQCLADDSFFTDYYSVKTCNEFADAINVIVSKMQPDEMLALHVETHGSDKGIVLSSGEVLKWDLFMSLCREINIKENGLLVVTTALCQSFSFLSCVDPFKRSPFLAIVITKRNVSAEELLRGYSEYYSRYKTINDVEAARDALQREVNNGSEDSSPFEVLTQYWIFDRVTKPDTDPELFSYLVNTRFCQLKSEDPSYTLERTEQEIMQYFGAIAKNERDHFLFADYWEN